MDAKNMTELMLFITFLTPITTAITEVVKRSVPHFPHTLGTATAILVSLGLASVAWVFTDLSAEYRIWGGLFAGLASAKVYDITKTIAKTAKKK